MPVRVFGVVPPAPVAPLVPRLGFLAGVALSSLLVGGCAKSEASADQAGAVTVASAEAPETTGAISPAQQVWRPSGGTASEAEIGALRQVATAARANRVEQATAARDQIRDPVAKALAEWMILRSNDSVGFARLSGFLDANPSFPASQRIRMRAEGSLLENNADAATVRQFFAHRQPTSAKGRVALAIALKRGGDQARAVRLIRETWHGYDLSSDVEDRVLAEFGGQISAGDHKIDRKSVV